MKSASRPAKTRPIANLGDQLRRIRIWLVIFIVGLVLSGGTAFPLQSELNYLLTVLRSDSLHTIAQQTHFLPWIQRVHDALAATNAHYPFLAYGTDWLAFGHLVIAVAFIGPYIDPVRNKWFITFGLIACAGVIPLALIAGGIRGIPIWWRLIDCSFGIFGAIPLLICNHSILEIERQMSFPSEVGWQTTKVHEPGIPEPTANDQFDSPSASKLRSAPDEKPGCHS